MLHSPEAYALSRRLPKIVQALKLNKEMGTLDNNRSLYELFFQSLERVNRNLKGFLEKDKCLHFFMGAYFELTGLKKEDVELFIKALKLEGCESVPIIRKQFPEFDFIFDNATEERLAEKLLIDLETKHSEDLAMIILVLEEFYVNTDKTPAEFLSELNKLFEVFSPRYPKIKVTPDNTNAPVSMLFASPTQAVKKNTSDASATSVEPSSGRK